MAEIDDSSASIIANCLYSSSQEDFLTHSKFAGENATFPGDSEVSTAVLDSGQSETELTGKDFSGGRNTVEFDGVCSNCEEDMVLGFQNERKRSRAEVRVSEVTETVLGSSIEPALKKFRVSESNKGILNFGEVSHLVQCNKNLVIDSEDKGKQIVVFRGCVRAEIVSPIQSTEKVDEHRAEKKLECGKGVEVVDMQDERAMEGISNDVGNSEVDNEKGNENLGDDSVEEIERRKKRELPLSLLVQTWGLSTNESERVDEHEEGTSGKEGNQAETKPECGKGAGVVDMHDERTIEAISSDVGNSDVGNEKGTENLGDGSIEEIERRKKQELPRSLLVQTWGLSTKESDTSRNGENRDVGERNIKGNGGETLKVDETVKHHLPDGLKLLATYDTDEDEIGGEKENQTEKKLDGSTAETERQREQEDGNLKGTKSVGDGLNKEIKRRKTHDLPLTLFGQTQAVSTNETDGNRNRENRDKVESSKTEETLNHNLLYALKMLATRNVHAADSGEVDIFETAKNREKQVIVVNSDSFTPWKVVSDHIGSKWPLQFDAPWPTYKTFPQATKDILWNEFQATFDWNPKDHAMVHRNYEKILAKRVTETWNRAKKKGKMKPENWVKPTWLRKDIWNGLLQHWNTPNFQARAERMRRNRRSDPEGLRLNQKAPVTHCAGARPFSENRNRFVERFKRDPTFEELYKWNHCSKKDNTWKSQHGKAWDAYQQSLQAYMAAHNLTEVPNNTICSQLWVAANMDKSGRVYGFGDDYITVRQQAGQPRPRIMCDPSFFTIMPAGCDKEAFRVFAHEWLNKLSKVDKVKVKRKMAEDVDDDDEGSNEELNVDP